MVAVYLAAGWKGSIEPYGLNGAVLEAANVAAARVLSHKMEGFDLDAAVSGSSVQAASADSTDDESRITSEDAMRLLDAVTADLNEFMSQVSAVADQPTHVESSGGHVTASGRRGQLMSVEINPQWAGSARDSEIEVEITEVLKRVSEKSSLGELAKGPQSRNIAELNALVRDPQALMRRVGLTPGHRPNDQGE
ncbi:hypothetical protein CDG81_15375 [Actinopolyspora erythraea]|uniref:Uncharacterized protein n=1 Tax=Actinopolyspora erythraea TaxID=414996 RepID=A0A223RU73_9ACTN|nr:hypothetical protein CDG81_15375 [Actinopolyspora erythraea]